MKFENILSLGAAGSILLSGYLIFKTLDVASNPLPRDKIVETYSYDDHRNRVIRYQYATYATISAGVVFSLSSGLVRNYRRKYPPINPVNVFTADNSETIEPGKIITFQCPNSNPGSRTPPTNRAS